MSGRGRPRGHGGRGGHGSSSSKWSSSPAAANHKGSGSGGSRGSSPSPRSASSSGRGLSLSPSRGRGQRGRPPKPHPRTPSSSGGGATSSTSPSPVKRRLSLDDTPTTGSPAAAAAATPPAATEESGGRRPRKVRRPRFQDNPPAPEIVEKGALKVRLEEDDGGEMKSSDCDTSSSTQASNGHEDDDEEGVTPMENGGGGEEEKQPGNNSRKRCLDSSSTPTTPLLSSPEVKRAKVSDDNDVHLVRKAVSVLVDQMVSEVDTEKEEGSTIVNGERKKSEAEESRLSRLLANVRDNLGKAVKLDKDDGKVLKSRLCDAVRLAVVKSRPESEQGADSVVVSCLLPSTAATKVKSVLQEFLDGKFEDDDEVSKKNSSDFVQALLKQEEESSDKTKTTTMQERQQQLLAEVLGIVEVMRSEEEKDKKEIKSASDISKDSAAPVVVVAEDVKKEEDATTTTSPPKVLTGYQREGNSSSSNNIVYLDQLQSDMVPVDSSAVEIEEFEGALVLADGILMDATDSSSSSVAKKSTMPNYDKSKLFSQMEDKFAKETHKALKNKPVYRRRINAAATEVETPEEGVVKEEKPATTTTNEAAESTDKILAVTEPGEISSSDVVVDAPSVSTGSSSKVVVSPLKSPSKEPSIASEIAATASSSSAATVEDEETKPTPLPELSSPTSTDVEMSFTEPTAESSSSSSLGGSELTKSLRKVRVRRSRTLSSADASSSSNSGDPNGAPPSMDSFEASPPPRNSSSSNADQPPKLEAEKDVISQQPLTPPPATDVTAAAAAPHLSPASPPAAPRLIRPRLVLSPKRPDLSESSPLKSPPTNLPLSPTTLPAVVQPTTPIILVPAASSTPKDPAVSVPLKIVIPPERHSQQQQQKQQHHHHHHHANSGLSNRRAANLLMTPSSKKKTLAKIKVGMASTVLKTDDASCISFAILLSPLDRKQGKKQASSVTPRLTLNGEVMSSSSSFSPSSGLTPTNGHHASLKTVIRLPKSSNDGKQKKTKGGAVDRRRRQYQDQAAAEEEEEEEEHPLDRRRKNNKNRYSDSSPRNSVSPISRRDVSAGAAGSGGADADRYSSADEGMDQPMHSGSMSSSHDGGGRTRTPDSQTLEGNALAESMVVPEKASSFNIHPERCCSDTCHYCSTRFGILDTPLHVSQLKTPEIKTFAMEYAGVSSDACLCDKCFRYIDRKAKAKKGASSGAGGRKDDERIRACLVRSCNREVTSNISKKWLMRLRKKLTKKVALNWERVTKGSTKSTFPMCNKHSTLVDLYSQCGLCKRKLTVGGICVLGLPKEEVMSMGAALRAENIPAELQEHSFVCKLCKAFTGIYRAKMADAEYLKCHKQQKSFYKEYRKKLHVYLGLDMDGYSTESLPSPKKIHQVSQSDNPTKITIKTTTLDVTPGERPSRKQRRPKEFASPNSEARIVVHEDYEAGGNSVITGGGIGGRKDNASASVASTSTAVTMGGGGAASSSTSAADGLEKCSVTIQFDLNTKKLWQDLHFPYGNYTSFFRHLILLEKYWRNGDLALSDRASQKASVYIRSVKNRIDAYEGKHKRSDYDLSASTRPDLSVPAAPDMLHLPAGYEGEGENSKTNSSTPPPPPPKNRKESTDTILRIPRIPMSMSSSMTTVPQPSTSPSQNALPTKIRVRTDLMHLGLMARPEPNTYIYGSSQQQQQQGSSSSSYASSSRKNDSFKIADLVATKAPPTISVNSMSSSSSQSNLLQLLNDPPVTSKGHSKSSSSSSAGPLLGKTQLIGPSTPSKSSSSQSSNSQLFKSAASGESNSIAIPLTFNNTIAEVYASAAAAAAAASNKSGGGKSKDSSDVSGKPEVTITAKAMQQHQQNQQLMQHYSQQQQKNASRHSLNNSSSDMMPRISEVRSLAQAVRNAEDELGLNRGGNSSGGKSAARSSPMMTSPSPSGGGSILHQQQKMPPKAHSSSSISSINSSTGVSNISRLHPLVDMKQLLQSQNPGIAPHIVAQSVMPSSSSSSHKTGSSSSSSSLSLHSMAKIAPKPPGPMLTNVRPVQLTKPVGIQTVNKKSLNTVLDRLSGLKSPHAPSGPTPPTVSSPPVSRTSSSSNSSLVQQLQAPPMSKLSSRLTSPSSSSSIGRSSSSSKTSLSSSASSSLNPFLPGFPGQMVGQPMVQYPSWAQMSQNQAAQQAALLMAGMTGMGSMSGLSQVQAAAAMQELMKMSLQHQQQQQNAAAAANRIRAPPPLTHMGRSSGGGSGGGNPKPKE